MTSEADLSNRWGGFGLRSGPCARWSIGFWANARNKRITSNPKETDELYIPSRANAQTEGAHYANGRSTLACFGKGTVYAAQSNFPI